MVTGSIARISRAVDAVDHRGLILKVTVLMVLLHGYSSYTLLGPLTVLAGAMLLFPALIDEVLLWWAILIHLIIENSRLWYSIDNHKYLIMYWVLACLSSFYFADPAGALRLMARRFLALVFVAATLWKLTSGEFLNGAFPNIMFVFDPRLSPLVPAISQLSGGELARFRQEWSSVVQSGATAAVLVPMNEAYRTFGLLMGWATLLVEGTLGLAYLGSPRLWYKVQHAALMIFIVGTYFVFPVVGFGFVLTAMGIGACEPHDLIRRRCYISILGIIQFAVAPWRTLL